MKDKVKDSTRKDSWVPVAHACYPNYEGDRAQEHQSSKPARQIVHKTLSQKCQTQKRTSVVA
jgi:hypothetical protein